MNARPKAIATAALAAALTTATQLSLAATPAKAPIVIGVTADQTGFAQGAGLAWAGAAEVWAKWINDKGGIAGHPVELRSRDTASVPATGAAALKELLGDSTVVAVAHGGNDTGAEALIANAAAPVIGGLNDNDVQTGPNVFSAGTTQNQVSEAVASLGINSNRQQPNGGFVYVPPNGDPIPFVRAGARKVGADLVYVEELPHDAPADHTPQCRAAQAKNVGWIWLLHYPTTVAQFAENCAAIGYRPTLLSTYYTADELKIPALDGMKFVMPNAVFNGPSPAAEEFRNAVARYAPDQLNAPYFGEYSIMAWASMQLIAKAIEAAHPQSAEVTRADVYRGLYSLKNETLGGLAPPLTFARGKPAIVSCYFTAEIRGGKLIASPKPQC